MAVTCFYFDYAARKEQTATSMLGSLLRQMVSGMEGIPEEILRAFQELRKAIGGSGPQLVDIVKMIQLITSSRRAFMVIDGLDGCAEVQRLKLFDSLKKIIEKSPETRVFVTGRPYIREEIEQRLAGHVVNVSVAPKKDDIVAYIRDMLDNDLDPEAMNERLEANILQKVPESMSEMCVRVMALRIPPLINC